jgi:transmembrane sensor
MTKEEKLKNLLKKFFNRSLSSAEKENLYFLISEEKFNDVISGELYKLWENADKEPIPVSPEKVFGDIKQKIDLKDNKLRDDELILKGIEYTKLKASRKLMTLFIQYAAVLILAMVSFSLINYFKERRLVSEIAYHEIIAPNGSKVRLLLSDSTEVWLNSGSRIKYPENFASAQREVFLEGEAFFNVTHDKTSPFFIKTSDLSIKVLGTILNVKSYKNENLIETSLISGQIEIIEFSDEGLVNESTVLLPDQKALYNKRTGKMRIENRMISKQKNNRTNEIVLKNDQVNTNIYSEIAWKDNKLVFNNETFSSLAIRLERWYNVEIDVTDEELLSFRFTGVLENETIEQAMYAFTIASSMEYKFEKNKITVWISNKK